jgi:hypothetical protein
MQFILLQKKKRTRFYISGELLILDGDCIQITLWGTIQGTERLPHE